MWADLVNGLMKSFGFSIDVRPMLVQRLTDIYNKIEKYDTVYERQQAFHKEINNLNFQ